MLSTTHVLPRLAMVICHDSLERTKRWYSNSLFFGWQGISSICAIKVVIRSKTSVRWLWLVIEKLNYRPRYLNDLPISTVGTKAWFNISLGKYWTEEVDAFFIPKVEHMSILIIMFVHMHHLAKWFSKIWFSFSKTCYDCCIVSKLKPMDRGKRAYGKS